jgi:hypothetical protein
VERLVPGAATTARVTSPLKVGITYIDNSVQ